MGLSYNTYGYYKTPGPKTRLKTAYSCTCRLHFLPLHKDFGLNTNSFSTLDSVLILNLALVRPQTWVCLNCMEPYNVYWRHKTGKHSEWSFVVLCQYRFSTFDHITYEDFLKFLKLHTLHNRRLYLDSLLLFLFIQV
jgi:hypothetical protein